MELYVKYLIGSEIQKIRTAHDLGIEIVHDGKTYTISVNNGGALVLRALSDLQLLVLPSASNAMEISSK